MLFRSLGDLEDVTLGVNPVATTPRALDELHSHRVQPLALRSEVLHLKDEFHGIRLAWLRRRRYLNLIGDVRRDRMKSQLGASSVKFHPGFLSCFLKRLQPERVAVKRGH